MLLYIRRRFWSGRWDSNPRPWAPDAHALTKLRYAPIMNVWCFRKGVNSQFSLTLVV